MPSPAPPRPESGPSRSLGELARLLDVEGPVYPDPSPGSPERPAWADTAVTGITHDSRAVRPGDLYAALPGARAHGADFVADAAAAGAIAVLTDPAGVRRAARATHGATVPVFAVADPRRRMGGVAAWIYGEPARELTLIGVTGTNGKTTTAYLLASGLAAAGYRTGLVGTIETRVDGEVIPSVRTTPEATDLQALFAVMRERGVGAAAMEVSSHALALGRVDGTVFDVAVFTNLSQDHLDFHADLEDYFAAKAGLFTPARCRRAVVNIDDEYGRRLAGGLEVPVTTFSVAGDARADWRASDVCLGPLGGEWTLTGPDGRLLRASVALPGPFNVENAVAALVALVAAGVPAEVAAEGMAALPGVPGRMERVHAGQSFLALVDYAHTPAALETLLEAVRAVTAGRVLVVVGCGGDRDRAKRPSMGAAAARLADVAVLTDDNPRSEDPREILAAMRAGAERVPAADRAELVVEPDRAAAIAYAVAAAGPDDAVVVAGKGHEQGQEAAGVVRPFDDRAVLRACIAGGRHQGGRRGERHQGERHQGKRSSQGDRSQEIPRETTQ